MKGFIDMGENFDELDEPLNADSGYSAPDFENQICYVITLNNTGDSEIENLLIGCAKKTLELENFGFPPEVEVTCEKRIGHDKTEPFSYKEFLELTLSEPFKAGQTFVQSPMGGQCYETVYLQGKELYKAPDPYRMQSNIQGYWTAYICDGTEELTLSKLYPKTECKFYIYPSNPVKFNRTGGTPCLQHYAPPKIPKNTSNR